MLVRSKKKSYHLSTSLEAKILQPATSERYTPRMTDLYLVQRFIFVRCLFLSKHPSGHFLSDLLQHINFKKITRCLFIISWEFSVRGYHHLSLKKFQMNGKKNENNLCILDNGKSNEEDPDFERHIDILRRGTLERISSMLQSSSDTLDWRGRILLSSRKMT